MADSADGGFPEGANNFSTRKPQDFDNNVAEKHVDNSATADYVKRVARSVERFFQATLWLTGSN